MNVINSAFTGGHSDTASLYHTEGRGKDGELPYI